MVLIFKVGETKLIIIRNVKVRKKSLWLYTAESPGYVI